MSDQNTKLLLLRYLVRALPSSQTTPGTLARRFHTRFLGLEVKCENVGHSPFQEVHFVEVERGFPTVEGNHEGQTNRCFRGSNRNDKERKYLTAEIL